MPYLFHVRSKNKIHVIVVAELNFLSINLQTNSTFTFFLLQKKINCILVSYNNKNNKSKSTYSLRNSSATI